MRGFANEIPLIAIFKTLDFEGIIKRVLLRPYPFSPGTRRIVTISPGPLILYEITRARMLWNWIVVY